MNKQKGLPINVSKLAAIDMPKGSGKKIIHVERLLKNIL